jgi:hypothetical protein
MMRQDDIERMLASEDPIEPTAGFTAGVMEAVRREAETPVPIAFPWRRAVPGMVLAVVGTCVLGVLAVTTQAPAAAAPTGPVAALEVPPHLLLAGAALVVACLVAYLVVRFSLRGADARL